MNPSGAPAPSLRDSSPAAPRLHLAALLVVAFLSPVDRAAADRDAGVELSTELLSAIDDLAGLPAEARGRALELLRARSATLLGELEALRAEIAELERELAEPAAREAELRRQGAALETLREILGALGGPASSPPADLPASTPATEPSTRGVELYGHVVAPLLESRCFSCHDSARRRSGLDLSTRAAALAGGDHGPGVVPGDPEASSLFRHVAGLAEPRMPFKEAPLSEAEIAAIREWIAEGAPYGRESADAPADAADASGAEGEAGASARGPMLVTDADRASWQFRRLDRPAVPSPSAGSAHAEWPANPIDRFLLAGMEAKGVAPNPSADRRTLLRRVFFDVIGLPPSPTEIDAFLDDPRPDDEAWGALVDRLLADPRHGERWARHWLDVARYAESHGYEQDYDRPNAWHYRDFVVQAFNRDLPYDRFVRYQIAGDEFEPESPFALAATGFLAAGTHSTQITKSQVEKERYDELDDMVSTIGTAMLGLTIGCARCHDHKYDPIPTRDYYRMLSTFTTTVRADLEVVADPEAHGRAMDAWEETHRPLADALAGFDRDQLPGRFERWLATEARDLAPTGWVIVEPAKTTSAGGATLRPLGDGSLLAEGANPERDAFEFEIETGLSRVEAIRVEALAHESLPKGGPGRASNGNFALCEVVVTARPRAGGDAVEMKLIDARADHEQAGLSVKSAIDGDPRSAWAIAPEMAKDHAATFRFERAAEFEGGVALVVRLVFEHPNAAHVIGRPRVSIFAGAPKSEPNAGAATAESSKSPGLEAALLSELASSSGGVPPPLAPGAPAAAFEAAARLRAAGDPASISETDRAALLERFKELDEERRPFAEAVCASEAARPVPETTTILVASEGVSAIRNHTQGEDFLPETHFLRRGSPAQKDGVATQGFLNVLVRDSSPSPEARWIESPPEGWRTSWRRRSLSNWLVDLDAGAGPLLARVAVNRLWHHHFGRGIVATPGDFGAQGEDPSDPALLEWLACELVDSGWSLRHVHRLILTSRAWRQSAEIDPAREALDPENALFARRARRRLEAEAIRDAMLASAGALDPRMGGPGTLQPHYRRSLYFQVKRSRLVPMMLAFDAPDTTGGIHVRPETTVAPQALLLMNDPWARDVANRFAASLPLEPDGAPGETAIREAHLRAFAREPSPEDLADGLAFLAEQRDSYRAALVASAGAGTGTGAGAGSGTAGASPDAGAVPPERAALADYCQALLGSNEFAFVD